MQYTFPEFQHLLRHHHSRRISVSNDGDVNEIGYGVDRDRSAVRPALWFTLYN